VFDDGATWRIDNDINQQVLQYYNVALIIRMKQKQNHFDCILFLFYFFRILHLRTALWDRLIWLGLRQGTFNRALWQ